MKTRDSLVRMLTWRFQTMGIGRVANRTSVRMLMAGDSLVITSFSVNSNG
jgi:hypothetical protein